jgi:hypothetical protein
VNQRRRLVPVLVAVPLLLSAACTIRVEGRSSAGSASSSTTAPKAKSGNGTSPTTTVPAPTDENTPTGPGFPADGSDKGGPAKAGSTPDPAGQMHVSGFRIASQQRYTRLVVTLTSHGVPTWTARYTEASGPGGGPVDIQGDAFLRVALRTGAEPGNQGQSDTKLSPGPIAEAKTTGFFEGSEEVLIGTRGGKTPFRAFALTDPGRIVIDMRPAG